MDARQRGAFYLRWSLSARSSSLCSRCCSSFSLRPPLWILHVHIANNDTASPIFCHVIASPRSATAAARHRRPAYSRYQPEVPLMSGLLLLWLDHDDLPSISRTPSHQTVKAFLIFLMILALESLIRSQNPSNEFLKPCEDFLLLHDSAFLVMSWWALAPPLPVSLWLQ